MGDREKTGVFTGGYAINPATNDRIPVWIADYVLMEYGTGAIMAVPGHDERDFEFAKKFGLRIVRVVAEKPEGTDETEGTESPLETAYTDNESGVLVNSGQFDGKPVPEAKTRDHPRLESHGAGKGVVQYRLHDWCISRQRYWGPPIPMIYCDQHGAVPVPEKDLPVELPLIEDFAPDDSGISPLARHEEWYYVPCPTCGKRSRRETDVSDTFLDSSWYHLRYPSTDFDDRPFDPALTKKWLPVHTYIGGNEHAVLHLLYARFITMVLHDLGRLPFDEPYRKFRAHGLIVKDGAKMSKSRGNVVVPDEYIARWGADTFRMYLMFLGPFQEGGDFRDEGISGPRRFLDKVWGLVTDSCRASSDDEMRHETLVKYHQTVKRVTEGMEELRYNTSHRGADGTGERVAGGELHASVAGGGADRHAGAVRAALRGGELGAAGASAIRCSMRGGRRGMTGLVVEDQVEVVVQIEREDAVEGVGAARCGSGSGGSGGAAGCGGAEVYGGEGGKEGGVCAESVAELGTRLGVPGKSRSSRVVKASESLPG